MPEGAIQTPCVKEPHDQDGAMRSKVCLKDAFDACNRHWSPVIVAELNDQLVKIAKLEGEFIWHSHADEDELFLVRAGRLKLHLRDRTVELGPGELFVVPRGVEHKPEAEEEVEVLLFEPKETRNTGDIDHALTIEADDLEGAGEG